MALSPVELGRRIRLARKAKRLTQEATALYLGVSRPTFVLLEQGKRSVSSLELARLAHFLEQDLRSFVSETLDPDTLLGSYIETYPELGSSKVMKLLRRYLLLGREFTRLQNFVAETELPFRAAYASPPLSTSRNAILHGIRIAKEERKRLQLGAEPAPNLINLLHCQNIRVASVELPDDFMGISLVDPDQGPLIVCNASHSYYRQRFTVVHEYAHILMDRNLRGHVSRRSQQTSLVELRADCFALEFLAPEEGIQKFLGRIGKPPRSEILFDPDRSRASTLRSQPAPLQLPDILRISLQFDTDRKVILHRLFNLGLLQESELLRFTEMDDAGRSEELANLLGIVPPPSHDFRHRYRCLYILVALEAYQRKRLTHEELQEHLGRLEIDPLLLTRLLDAASLRPNSDPG